MEFVKKEIVSLNKKFGGSLRADNIDYAIAAGKGKSDYKKLAYLWRAILVDHAFSDGNKRTATALTISLAREKKKEINKKRLIKEIIEVARKNIIHIGNIERRIRYVIEGI